MLSSILRRLSSVLFCLLFATSAQAYDDLYLDPFTTSNWNASSGWQSCAAYSGGRPCISNGSYFSGDGISAGDVVFAYTTNNISDTFSITSTMRSSTGSNYVAIDMMTGPRNSEQGNKTEYVGITIIKYSSVGSQIQSYSFSENITNTSMETFAYDIGSLANTYNIGIIISGRDGGYWGGNYGAVIGAGSLYITAAEGGDIGGGESAAAPTPVYSSGITAEQSSRRAANLPTTGMEANINIEGNSNLVTVEQIGDAHYLELGIVGSSNVVDIEQTTVTGGQHYLEASIQGSSNQLDILQSGTAKSAFVTIDGDNNIANITQQDTGQHYLQLDMIGDGHVATILQEGSGNHAATVELENGGGAWDFDLTQSGATSKEYSLPHSMSDGSTTSGTCYVAAGCSLSITQND
jgi:hypothetical protein